MKKVLDKALEAKIGEIISGAETPEEAASQTVEKLRELQDAGGLKICQVITEGDPAAILEVT